MQKLLLLSDKEELPLSAFSFARMMNEQEQILLTGVFLPYVDYWNSLLYYSYGLGAPILFYTPQVDVATVENAIPQFNQLCQKYGIEYRIHDKEYDNIKNELRKETRFADLLVFSNSAFYQHLDEVTSDEYIDNTLHYSECPVVILPEKFEQPRSVLLTYDGSPSSVYAIRQFATLFPELAELETTLVYVNPEASGIPDLAYLEELTSRHYPQLEILHLKIDPKKYFTTWLANRKNTILVAGAEGRNRLSELFRKSFISDILKEHQLPVFIAHK